MRRFRKWDLLASKSPTFSLRTKCLSHCKAMKPHTLAKEVIKLCVVDMADIILGDGAARKLKQLRCQMMQFVEESMISILIFAIN